MNLDTSEMSLAAIRHNRGVSLEQIASATKISIRALQAIELGDFSKLPGGIYNTSYIRQYAQAIDFDAGVLLEYYYHKTGLMPDQGLQDGFQGSKDKGVFSALRPSTILGL